MPDVIVVQPGGGESISGGPSVRHVKVDIEGLHVTEYSVEAAPMGDLHTHRRHADAFYVLEGELEVAVSETETVVLLAGGFAAAPPGAVHAFAVPERARFLNIHGPGMSFATYLREIVALRERGKAPGRELFERFDMHLVD
ncbi:MAG TPA: cupin domain-containing protein [Actinomycetota bacterium]|nr:cupin domain-containing protein [Actinomycetota bacterium]